MTQDDDLPTGPTPASIVMQHLFPVDTATWTSRLLGLQKRSVDRMMSGYSMTNPKLLEKLAAQAFIRDRMVAKFMQAIAEAEAEGGHRMVLRYGVADILHGDRLADTEDPL